MPSRPRHDQQFVDAAHTTGFRFAGIHLFGGFPTITPGQKVALIAVAGFCVFILWILFVYASSVMRFVLFDSVLTRNCEIRRGWSRRHGSGWSYFLWQIVMFLATAAAMVILIGIPAGVGFALGWFTEPKQHLIPLILGGMALFFVVLAFLVTLAVVHVTAKDFVVPVMALEGVGAVEGWRRVIPMLKAEKGSFAGYFGMKVLMAIGAGIVLGIVSFVVILILVIPFGGMGAIAVLGGKAMGLAWNLYTISLAVLVGTVLLSIILYAFSLVSVPAIVFFPAYSIYFFAARYVPLQVSLYPPPQAPSSPPLYPTQPEPAV